MSTTATTAPTNTISDLNAVDWLVRSQTSALNAGSHSALTQKNAHVEF